MESPKMSTGEIESISAVILAIHDMARAVRFYSALGFPIRYGGESAAFTSFHAGRGYLNLIATAHGLALLEVGPFDLLRLGRGRQASYVATHEQLSVLTALA